jgi:DNA mismatch repair protein MutL
MGEILGKLGTAASNTNAEKLLDEVLNMMACKAAVKAGDPLSPAEITALLANWKHVEGSSNCPHGRPTVLRLSLADLEKQFHRT